MAARGGTTSSHSFILACQKGDVDAVNEFVAQGGDVDHQNEEAVCGLFEAAKCGHVNVVGTLIKNGADVNKGNGRGNTTAIHMASKNGHSVTLKLLIENGADVNQQDDDGWSALLFATYFGHTLIVKCLLECGKTIFINIQAINDGWSALMYAVLIKHIEIATILLEYGANVNLQNNIGSTSSMIASKNGCTDIVNLLIVYNANVNIQMDGGWSALMFAGESGHVKIAKNLLIHGADVNMQTVDGLSALILASQNGHSEMVQLLLDYNANVNDVTSTGSSALMFASQEGHPDVVQLLLECGAYVNLKMNKGITALMIGCLHKSNQIVRVLLTYKADVNMNMVDRVSPLIIASQNGSSANVQLLLENSAEVNRCDIDGWSALLFASQHGFNEIVKLLLEHKANVNRRDNNGWSALMLSNQNGHVETTLTLLENAADTNLQTNDGLSALMLATQNGHTENVRLLLEHSADVDLQDKSGSSALIIASQRRNKEIIKLLVEYKANVNEIDKNGWTALMFATQTECTQSVKTLVELGADVNARANNRWTALMIADLNGDTETAKVLREYQTESKTAYGFAGITRPSDLRLIYDDQPSDQGSYSPASSSGGFFRFALGARNSMYGSIRGSKRTLGISSSGYGSASSDGQRSTPDLSGSSITSSEGLKPLTNLYWTLPNWKCAETAVLVTNSEKDQFFSWPNYGLNLHILSHSLPPGYQSCTLHITATVVGDYEFPKSSYLVSPVYWIQCIPRCKFVKPVAVEIQHCSKQRNRENLYFVKSNETAQEHLFVFQKAQDYSFTNYGIFPAQGSYGFIQLESFSGYGIVQEGSEERSYCANIYYLGQEESHCKIDFAISWNTEAHRTVVNEHYRREGTEPAVDQQVEFESDHISLDIPMKGVLTENKGWKILPLTRPVISKKEVDSFDAGKRIPAVHLQAKAVASAMLTDLQHIVNLEGAKQPFNVFTLYRQIRHVYSHRATDSTRESNPLRIKWGDSEQLGPRPDFRDSQRQFTHSSDDSSASNRPTNPQSRSKIRRNSTGFDLVGRFMKWAKLRSRQQEKNYSGMSQSTLSLVVPTLSAATQGEFTAKTLMLPAETDTKRKDELLKFSDPVVYEKPAEAAPSPPEPLQYVVLLRELSEEVSARWEDIGIYLRLKPGTLEIIKKDNPGDCRACFREMLKVWMKQIEPPPSWAAIITAIKSSGYHLLARQLKRKYLPGYTLELLV